MEEWQIEHITQNLNQLIQLTTINSLVKAELVAKNILCKADVDKLDAVQKLNGDMEACRHYYQLLLTRKGAYRILYETLVEANQSGAFTILIRVPHEIFSKPLTYLGISTDFKNFQDVHIEVNGKTINLREFFSTVDNESLQQVFTKCLTQLEIYDTFITKQRTYVLASESVPQKLPYYVSRYLSNRIKLNETIFKADSHDVFVFKESIPRYKVTQLAKPHYTDRSSSQLDNIKSRFDSQLAKIPCRFIHLDKTEDWIEFKKSAKVPTHLINYEADGNIFLLEDTSAPSDILRRLNSKSERVYFFEDEFVKQQLSNDSEASSVCICDTPGMGKTLLLANIARLMTKNCTGRIIVFVSLTAFATDFVSPNSTLNDNTVLLNVIKYVSTSHQNKYLLLELFQTNLLRMEVFFDGFDEVSSDKVELVKQILIYIVSKFPNVRMYITSRPHMRQELETILNVLAYDISPFTQQNQIYFLTSFWSLNASNVSQTSLQVYATSCLDAVNESLSRNDKEITGIPLLCHLIAEVYADKIPRQSIKRRKFCHVPFTLAKMYQKFIKKKINLFANDRKEFDEIKLVHIWHALKLLFPSNDFHEGNQFKDVSDLLTSAQNLRVGILMKHSNATSEFIHRTFAEYLVAEYFLTKLQAQEVTKKEDINCNSITILKLLLQCQQISWEYYFEHPVIVSFLNSALSEVNTSEELKIQTTIFVASILHEELINRLCACCQHDLSNIFYILMDAVLKCDYSAMLECFTNENCYEILSICIRRSTSQMFRCCIQLSTEKFKRDVKQIASIRTQGHLIRLAVESNYEAVEYFMDKITYQIDQVLPDCVTNSYFDDTKVVKRENILQLLLNSGHVLTNEIMDILVNYGIHLRLIKVLIKFGVNIRAVNNLGQNCAMVAGKYMSSIDFHEFVEFILSDCKAEVLFLDTENWKEPVQFIIKWCTILPRTLGLLFKIPLIDINMEDKNGENLLFSAVKGNNLINLQQLVNYGLDYNARGSENTSLIHAAAMCGGPGMVQYLLSLNLDPNSCEDRKWTPLHYAVYYFRQTSLSVVRILVENGANVKAKTDEGQTAIHFAAQYSNMEVMNSLIGKEVEINDTDNKGNTALHLCKNKHTIECLIKMGADIHAKNNEGQTPAQTNPAFYT